MRSLKGTYKKLGQQYINVEPKTYSPVDDEAATLFQPELTAHS